MYTHHIAPSASINFTCFVPLRQLSDRYCRIIRTMHVIVQRLTKPAIRDILHQQRSLHPPRCQPHSSSARLNSLCARIMCSDEDLALAMLRTSWACGTTLFLSLCHAPSSSASLLHEPRFTAWFRDPDLSCDHPGKILRKLAALLESSVSRLTCPDTRSSSLGGFPLLMAWRLLQKTCDSLAAASVKAGPALSQAPSQPLALLQWSSDEHAEV